MNRIATNSGDGKLIDWTPGLALFLAVSTTIGAKAASADWIQFRGNEGQGVAIDADPPIKWSESQHVQWKIDVPGAGWSSPVIKDGRVYLTSAVAGAGGSAGSLQVLAFQLDSGRSLWSTKVFDLPSDGPKHDKNSHASATPFLGRDRIYAHFGHFGTVCLSVDGTVLWRQESLGYKPVHGNGGSPVLVRDKLIYSADGIKNPVIIALDRDSGELVWKRERKTGASRKFSFSTPLLVSVNGHREIVSPASGAVFGYSPETGEELWHVDYGQGYSVVPRPIAGHGHVYVATGFGRPNVLAIRLGGRGDLTDSNVTWKTSRSGPKTPSMLLHDENLYYVSDGGIVSCVNALTGTQVWQDRVKGNVSSSPIIAGGRIYVATEEGVMYVLRTGDEFELLAENRFGERIFASPAVSGDALVVRTETQLIRIEKK